MNRCLDKTLTGVGGLTVGAALMYLLDPDRGKRRRAVLRDKVVHLVSSTGEKLDVKSRDAGNRVRGLVSRSKSLWRRQRVADSVVAERVKARLGHAVSHPGSIEVSVQDGRVVLGGAALANEAEALLSTVTRVRGVTGVENRLELHDETARIPGLPG